MEERGVTLGVVNGRCLKKSNPRNTSAWRGAEVSRVGVEGRCYS